MDYEDIRVEITDGIARITLDRPEQRNAFSGRMGISLGRAYQACDTNDEVRAVVLTGSGDAFCVGADFSGGGEVFEKQESVKFSAAGFDPPAFRVRKPVIAAVNGHAVGIGLSIVMQCDIRIFALEGKYGFLHTRRGVLPDAYSHWTVPRAIGHARTADLFLTGRRFQGQEALDLGLASRAVTRDDVLPAAMEIARDIAVNVAPLSAALSKTLLWDETADNPAAVERKETALHHAVMGQPDALEGAMAFLEKRDPDWQLRVGADWPKEWPK
jgi:enoyl-CoA hydratase/carnithine racemase